MYIITMYERRIEKKIYCFFYDILDPSIEWICKRDIIYDAESFQIYYFLFKKF